MKEKKQGLIKAKKPGFFSRFFVKPVATTRKIVGLAPQAKTFVKLQKDNLDNWSEIAREKLKNPAKANFELGQKFYQEHHYRDAVIRFKIANFMNKNYPEACYALGKAYLALHNLTKASQAFSQAKSLGLASLEQDYFFQIYCQQNLNCLAPKSLIKEYFTIMSDILDEEHFAAFSYVGDQQIRDLLSAYSFGLEAEILDLGCGSGILGKAVKALFPKAKISGLDFSQEMLEIAKDQYISLEEPEQDQEIIDLSAPKSEIEKRLRIYDFLIRTDIETYQDDTGKKYDAIVARGILDFVSDLDSVMAKLSQKLKLGGLLIFFQRREAEQDRFSEILKNYSFPFYCIAGNLQRDNTKAICQKYDLNLIEEQDFDLEDSFRATAFIYQK